MKFSSIAKELRTIRDYKKQAVEQEKIQEVINIAQSSKGITCEEKANISFIEDGKEIFNKLSGKAGYFGKMIEAPHYIAISSVPFKGCKQNAAYLMELMRFKAWELGLGTCWIHIEDETILKEHLNKENEEIIAFMAIGYQYSGVFKKDTSAKSGRMGVEDIIFLHKWNNPCTIEELENRGFDTIFYHTKLAPSWGNKQPWKFIIDDDKIVLAISKESENSMELDTGIVMLYLEKAAAEQGIIGSWNLDVSQELSMNYAIPETYVVVGYLKI